MQPLSWKQVDCREAEPLDGQWYLALSRFHFDRRWTFWKWCRLPRGRKRSQGWYPAFFQNDCRLQNPTRLHLETQTICLSMIVSICPSRFWKRKRRQMLFDFVRKLFFCKIHGLFTIRRCVKIGTKIKGPGRNPKFRIRYDKIATVKNFNLHVV